MRRFTGGRLTIEDVPTGTLNPWLTGVQVRREIKRLVREKEVAQKEQQILLARKKQVKILKLKKGARTKVEPAYWGNEGKHYQTSARIKFSGRPSGGLLKNLHKTRLEDLI